MDPTPKPYGSNPTTLKICYPPPSMEGCGRADKWPMELDNSKRCWWITKRQGIIWTLDIQQSLGLIKLFSLRLNGVTTFFKTFSWPLWPQDVINPKWNFQNALPFTIPKQFLEGSNSLGKLVIYHDMCAYYYQNTG